MTDKMKLNANEVRFKGRLPIEHPIEGEKDYVFVISGQRLEVLNHDNQDGTFDARFVVGISEVKVVDKEILKKL